MRAGTTSNVARLRYDVVQREPNVIINPYRFASGGSALPIPEDGLMAWYKLDEGSGTTANDSSGRGNTLTIDSSAYWSTYGLRTSSLIFENITLSDLVMTGPQTIIAFLRKTADHDTREWAERIARSHVDNPSKIKITNKYTSSSGVLCEIFTETTGVKVSANRINAGGNISDFYLAGFRFDTYYLTANRNLYKATATVPDSPQNIKQGDVRSFDIGQYQNYTRDLIFYNRYITDTELEQIHTELI